MVAQTSQHLKFNRELIFNKFNAGIRLGDFIKVNLFIRLDKQARIIFPFNDPTIDQTNFLLFI